MNVKLIRGVPVVAHLTAPSTVVPGDVVEIGNTPVIAVNRCASGEVGAFAVGGGIYEMTAATDATAPTAGTQCNFATSVVIGTETGNVLGVCLSVSSADCVVLHQPTGVAVA